MANLNRDLFLVRSKSSIRDAWGVIEKNQHGIAFVTNTSNLVIGAVTDGDIRRWLMQNSDLNSEIDQCMNKDFVYGLETTSREKILKLLDNQIKVVPILSNERMLVSVVTSEWFPLKGESRICIRARAPVRVSFGGGGTDLTNYFMEYNGAVINATIGIYSHVFLRKRLDSKININSRDIKSQFQVDHFEKIKTAPPPFKLIIAVLELIQPDYGFDLLIQSDFPVGSGLGGSATVATAILGAFNELRSDKWDKYEIAELAFQAERLSLHVAGGWQDQYASVFGGFNFIEFRKENNTIYSLRMPAHYVKELEESLILCDSGLSHHSGDLQDHQKKQIQESSKVRDLIGRNRDLTYEMRDMLLRGFFLEFGKSLDVAWSYKKQFSSMISNLELDQIYDLAKSNGALGGKLLGAGKGGFFLFYVDPLRKNKLIDALENRGLKPQSVVFEPEGLQVWSLREDRILEGLENENW